jgi:hypothetical protein
MIEALMWVVEWMWERKRWGVPITLFLTPLIITCLWLIGHGTGESYAIFKAVLVMYSLVISFGAIMLFIFWVMGEVKRRTQ